MASLSQDLIRGCRPVMWLTQFTNYMVSAWPGRYPVTWIPSGGTFWSHPNLLYKQHIVAGGETDLSGNHVPHQWSRQKLLTYQTAWSKDQMWEVVKDIKSHPKHLSFCKNLIVYDEKTEGDVTTLRIDMDILDNPCDGIVTIRDHYMLMELVDKYDNEFVFEFVLWHADEDWREQEYMKQAGTVARLGDVELALEELEKNQVANWLDHEIHQMFERQKFWDYVRQPYDPIPDKATDPTGFNVYLKKYLLNERTRLTAAQKAFVVPEGDPSLITMPTRLTCTFGIWQQPSIDVPQHEPRTIDEMLYLVWKYWRGIFALCRERHGDPKGIPSYPENMTNLLGHELFALPVPFDPKMTKQEMMQYQRNTFMKEMPGVVIKPDRGGETWLNTPPPTAAEIKHKY